MGTRHPSSLLLSVIVPTCDRPRYLAEALASIRSQTLPGEAYEVLVIDNSESGGAAGVVAPYLEAGGAPSARYFREPAPGLVHARHCGAREARGHVLVFCDDDIVAAPGWLEAVLSAFANPRAALVGGKVEPLWEAPPPPWLPPLFVRDATARWMMHLSLVDCGDERREIPPNYVFGCNFSIRSDVLFRCGGFHPDALPQRLIRLRGDGEYGLALALAARGLSALYAPGARVAHRVPTERLSPAYFCRRSFNQGVSDSYTEIRRRRAAPALRPAREMAETARFAEAVVRGALAPRFESAREFPPILEAFRREGVRYHRDEVAADPALLAHVLRDTYFEPEPLPGPAWLPVAEESSGVAGRIFP